jgi:hypothetical protein
MFVTLLVGNVIILSVAIPAIYYLNRSLANARSRVSEHRCVGCGYDLRESPDRCPECGLATPRRLDPAKIHRLPSQSGAELPEGGPIGPLASVVFETADLSEARILTLHLRVAGIVVKLIGRRSSEPFAAGLAQSVYSRGRPRSGNGDRSIPPVSAVVLRLTHRR